MHCLNVADLNHFACSHMQRMADAKSYSIQLLDASAGRVEHVSMPI